MNINIVFRSMLPCFNPCPVSHQLGSLFWDIVDTALQNFALM